MTAIERDIQKVIDQLNEIAIERAALQERLAELDSKQATLVGELSTLKGTQLKMKATFKKYGIASRKP